MRNPTPSFSPASLLCSKSLPSTVVASSVACGWTAALVEHHRVEPDDEPFETAPTPDQTIVVMMKGEQDLASFRAGVWRHAAYRAGTIGMTPAYVTDRLRRRTRGRTAPFEKVNLYVPQQILQDASEQYRRSGSRQKDQPIEALAFQDTLVAHTAASLVHGMTAGYPNLYAEAAIHWLAVRLIVTHGKGLRIEDQRLPGPLADKRLGRVIEYMSANLADPLTLEGLAAEAGVSKFHFTRLFHAAVGMTPYVFLLELRLEAARTLLTGADLGLRDVAARCGFGRAAHFGTAFTKRFGMSPAAFRRLVRR